MRSVPSISVLALVVLTWAGMIESAPAADIPRSVGRPAFIPMELRTTSRTSIRVHPRRVYRTHHFVIRKTIGMPCLLPPHVIVQFNWNGPQCRWHDNIMPSARLRYRIAVR